MILYSMLLHLACPLDIFPNFFFFCFSKSSIFFFAASQTNFYATRELILFCLEVTSIVTALVRLGLQLIKRDDLSFVPRILCSPFRGHLPNWTCFTTLQPMFREDLQP